VRLRGTAITRFTGSCWRFEQHMRRIFIPAHRPHVIRRWKQILVAEFDANFGVQIERDHPAHFIEDF
jgi:hypothetical protein